MTDLSKRLRAKADEIDRAVSRDKDDRDAGNWNEIELLREAADEIETMRANMNPDQSRRAVLADKVRAAVKELFPDLKE